jgi:glucokinase-like ROK family protein
VHIGIGMFRVALTDLQADIVFNRMESFDTDRPANIVLDEIAQVVESTVTQSRVDKALILGIGVGASGLVNHETGINVHAPSLDWHNIRVRDYLTSRLNLPVCVDNNVRTMALGEAYFGLGRTVDLLAFIYGRIGVGAGLVVNGHVFRGSRAGAGEIGHTIIIPNGGARCRCSQTGCLETLVAEPVLLAEARRLATKAPDGVLAHALRTTDDKPIEAVFAASRAGDPDANALLEERMRFLGIALTNLVNVLNPELIILGGMFAQGSDLIIPRVEATIRKQAFAGLGHRVRIVPTSFGWRAGVVGAASLALKTFFYEASSEAVDAR